ncbi:ATP-binding protein [Solimonas sp. SE-A11]|uniref:ATP-binding protein n=1 Tax=Solimonas sp. SE-A11 TaxID=3054954 RepID=UPI0034605988
MQDDPSKVEASSQEAQSLGKASFSVSSRVALQLGRESISSSITAVVELVKNSYDADAENVRIRFSSETPNGRILVIEDDGDGMTSKDLLDHWMVIGTSNKVERRRSAGKKRAVTGEKGLGVGAQRKLTQGAQRKVTHL